ncbi:hypothetical protein B0H13DRAFT_2679927 [Mycena leptocephala]|nr:hypothetical protein B0H13DRAFT_2679927 [Mycena leptocephala]
MMMHRVQQLGCLETGTGPEEHRNIIACMHGHIVDLAMNCYGYYVLQKALDCREEVSLLIVSELPRGDPATTLVNKHASHVWNHGALMDPPAPPIFAYVNKSLKGKWTTLACYETESLVVQHAFENLEESAKDWIVDEPLGQGAAVFDEITESRWNSYYIQYNTVFHLLRQDSHSDHHRYCPRTRGSKSVVKALKEGGKETLDRVVQRLYKLAKGARRAMTVDLALSLPGSQLIASVLPTTDKDQHAALSDCIRGHTVQLQDRLEGYLALVRPSNSVSPLPALMRLLDRMRAYYGY